MSCEVTCTMKTNTWEAYVSCENSEQVLSDLNMILIHLRSAALCSDVAQALIVHPVFDIARVLVKCFLTCVFLHASYFCSPFLVVCTVHVIASH
jgi:hypothetical protein